MTPPKKRLEKLEQEQINQDPTTILIRDVRDDDLPTKGNLTEAQWQKKVNRHRKPPVLIWDLPEEPAQPEQEPEQPPQQPAQNES